MSQDNVYESNNEVLAHYNLGVRLIEERNYGSGHINDTFLITFEQEDGSAKSYILQRINTDIFKNPDELMQNLLHVTDYLKNIIIKNGGNPDRETLNVIKTKSGDSYYRDESGSCWRVINFIEDAVSYDMAENLSIFYESAAAFGNFQYLLSDFPAETLHETIPNFHNTPKRLDALKLAVKEDVCGRAAGVQKEIEFAYIREAETSILVDMLAKGQLPLRVTHNDTKLNNVMIDKTTGKGICVIDLDTVMPGTAIYDFGDSIRFGASTGAEDERDLTKVNLDLNLYETYTKGYLQGSKGILTETEIKMLPWGAKLITLENGIRFLTDYLQGDVYYKTSRTNHNLDRCRTQFKLVRDMEDNWDKMLETVLYYIHD